MKIAIIGTGISGLSAAYFLQRKHDVELFEVEPRIGGHTATVDVSIAGDATTTSGEYAIDTGFIVFNDWTYPNFIRLLDEIGVESQATDMSFSVSCSQSGLEYAGSSVGALFAQRRRLFDPQHWGMLRDILRFNKQAIADLDSGRIAGDASLGEYLQQGGYGKRFVSHYLVPMGAAIWSASTETMLQFPLLFFVRFFKNHGLLNIVNRPQWRVIKGGSRQYLAPLSAGFADRIHVGEGIRKVKRQGQGVELISSQNKHYQFDHVVLACHSNQALAMLADPNRQEVEILSAIPYQENEVVLHTDETLLPKNRRAWTAWNYLLTAQEQERAVLTYNMNILQSLEAPETFCVTLNHTAAINPEKILRRFNYSHPVFTLPGMAAQARWDDINGKARTWYCGAYWANGFHEDGVCSALRVASALGIEW